MMFDEGPYHTGGSFRPEGELPAASVFEHVHLLLDHIGGCAEGSLKEIHCFKGGGANFLVAKTLKERAGFGFKMLKFGCVERQDVFGAAHGLILRHAGNYRKNRRMELERRMKP